MSPLAPRRRRRTARDADLDVLLVCSAGGHLLQLFLLEDAWDGLRVAWVTHAKDDSRSLLHDRQVYYAFGPTPRNVLNLFRNAGLAWTLLRRHRPRAVVTTGAGVAVPFCWLGRVLGINVVYIESLTRLETPSLSCRLIGPFANRTYVQWAELARTMPGARYVGNILAA
jgi:UDP-N-acetylglucosamine:LPS N-acetylglucosamine transferase